MREPALSSRPTREYTRAKRRRTKGLTTESVPRPPVRRAVWKTPVLYSAPHSPPANPAHQDRRPATRYRVIHHCGKVLWKRMAVAFSESAAREAWTRVLGRARAELPDTTIVMWFSDVRPIDLNQDVLTLAVPSALVRERLQHN